jgi:hypothetical protein
MSADLAAAATSAPALLLISPERAGCYDLGGCALLVDPTLFLALPAMTGKAGLASLPLAVPPAAGNLDLRLYLQWIIADGQGRLGPNIFALSGGAALRIGW